MGITACSAHSSIGYHFVSGSELVKGFHVLDGSYVNDGYHFVSDFQLLHRRASLPIVTSVHRMHPVCV